MKNDELQQHTLIKKLVAATLNKINKNLNELISEASPLSQRDLVLAIQTPIQKAFQIVDNHSAQRLTKNILLSPEYTKNKLYINLMLSLNSTNEEYAQFKRSELALGGLYYAKPTKTLHDALLAHRNIVLPVPPYYSVFDMRKLFSILLARLQSISYEYQRYPQWLQYPMYALQAITNVILLVGFLVSMSYIPPTLFAIVRLTIYSFNLSNSFWFFDKEHFNTLLIQQITTKDLADFYREYLLDEHLTDHDLSHESDEAILKIIQNHDGLLDSRTSLLESYAHRLWGIQYAKLLFDTLYLSISAPLPKDTLLKVRAIVFRGLQCLLFVPVVIIDSSFKMLRSFTLAMLSMAMIASFALKTALTVISLLPLMIYDMFKYLYKEKPGPDLLKTSYTIHRVTDTLTFFGCKKATAPILDSYEALFPSS